MVATSKLLFIVIICTLAAAAMVAADTNATAIPPSMNLTNQTFTGCMTGILGARNACFDAAFASRETCVDATRASGQVWTARRTCTQLYKKTMSSCKDDFNMQKKSCFTLNHTPWEGFVAYFD